MIVILSTASVTFWALGRLAVRSGEALKGVAARFGRAIQNRRAATRLAGLDDHMLADIGLTRSDLRDAYSEPLWHDPTDILASRAAERRSSRPIVQASFDDAPKLPWLECETAPCR